MKVKFQYEKDVFRFYQLEKKIREEVVNRNRIRDSEDHQNAVQEQFECEMENRHINFLTVRWSLSCCQGDGVSFDQKEKMTFDQMEKLAHILLPQHQAFRLVNLWNPGRVFELKMVRITERYVHKNTFCVDIEWDNSFDERKYKQIHDLVERFTSIYYAYLRDICSEFETVGYGILDSFDEDHYKSEFDDQKMLFFCDGSRVDICEMVDPDEVLNSLFPKE